MKILDRRWGALVAMAMCLVVIGLDTTVLNVALPTIAVDLHAGNSELQWFADAYLLVLAALLLPLGTLADRIGRKRLTEASLVVFAAGSLWCALASDASALIAARVLLGVGAAALLPLAMSIVVVLFEPHERPRAIAVISAATMIGLPAGPIVGGVLLNHFWWGSVFLINVPVIVVALVAVLVLVPADGRTRSGHSDPVGIALSSAGLVGLTFGLIEGPDNGWSSPGVVASLATATLLLAVFVGWEARGAARPVMDLALWRNPAFRWGTIGATLTSFAVFGVLFVLPQYFRSVADTDALGAGLRTLPMLVGMIAGIQLGSRFGPRLGSGRVCAAGFVLLAAGMLIGSQTGTGTGFAFVAGWTVLAGLGTGAALATAQFSALAALERTAAGAGSAVVQAMRQVGSVTGIAVLGAVLNAVYRDRVSLAGVPTTAQDTVRDSVASGVATGRSLGIGDVVDSARHAFTHGMATVLVIAAIASVVAAVAMWFGLLSDSPLGDGPESQDAAERPEPAQIH